MGEPGSLLGVFYSETYVDLSARLDPGDSLLVYTDGVTEGRRNGDFYGDSRLHARLASHAGSADTLTQDLLADVLQFQQGRPHDDIALVSVRVPPEE